MAYSKLQNKFGKFLTAVDKKYIKTLFYRSPTPPQFKKNIFPEALGTFTPIFKLLGVMEVHQKIGKALMSNRS